MDSNQMNNQETSNTNNGYQADSFNNQNNGAYDYQPDTQAYNTYDTQNQYTTYNNTTITSPIIEESKKGRGFVGALVGALIGGAIWTAIGCLGLISGWIAFLIFFLAQFGYKKMAGKMDKFGVVISLVLGLLMILPATSASYAFSVWKELNDGPTSHFTYMDVLFDLPMYMNRYDLWGDLIYNLFMGYLFTAVPGIYMGASALGNKLNAKKAAKRNKNKENLK